MKKTILSAGAAAVTILGIAAGVAFAQSPTTSPRPTATPTTAESSTTVPEGAPATGMAR